MFNNLLNTTVHLELFGEVSIYFGLGVQIMFALVLGGIVGYDREVKMKAAGFKTNIMICIGATIYTTMSMLNLDTHSIGSVIDPNRVSAQIVSGIGFLGAGAIIQGRGSVTGLTTAATIWVVAAIGYTIGVGYPIVATMFSITVLVVLRMLNPINKFIEKEKDFKAYHVEMLSYGTVKQTIINLLEMEGISIISIEEEEHPNESKMSFLNIYVKGHFRAIERVTSEISDVIRIKKVTYHQILNAPESNI
ncbi:MAG: MgtC/SapB family protein [Halobacteriovoraceae bacterium]|jgi:putative Mg2+ transporter-C (MgtC) family protein|nr:MgtC/SapB family protein [Halobacteriovoraceae bacterium]